MWVVFFNKFNAFFSTDKIIEETNEKAKEIISKEPRHYTDRNQNETDRYRRIAINSVFDYNDKDNRHTAPDLTNEELDILNFFLVDTFFISLINSLKWFEYGDLVRINEIWKHDDEGRVVFGDEELNCILTDDAKLNNFAKTTY